MLDHLYELFIYLKVVCTHILTVLERDLDAKLVEFGLLILIELLMLEGRIFLFEIAKQTVSFLHFQLYTFF